MTDPNVTKLLEAVNSRDSGAYDRLLEVIYTELHALARMNMRREQAGHTLQPTVLVNEAYLRLAESEGTWENRRHFFGAAAEAMRRVLVEHARRKRAQKRGGAAQRVTFSDIDAEAADPDLDVLLLDETLQALEVENPRLFQVVQLRFFAGLSIEQTAELLGVGTATVKRDWTYARAWLYERMGA